MLKEGEMSSDLKVGLGVNARRVARLANNRHCISDGQAAPTVLYQTNDRLAAPLVLFHRTCRFYNLAAENPQFTATNPLLLAAKIQRA